jgi:hypothetical protein
MEYYINWSVHTGRYLVKQIGEGKIIAIFNTKAEAENFINELENN